MDDVTLTDAQGPGEDGLHEAVAEAFEEHQNEGLIAELGRAESEAPETPETPETPGADEEAPSDAGPGDEALDDGGADQTEETEPPPSAAREAADDGQERGQVAEAYQAAVAPFQAYLASKGVEPTQAVRILLAAEHQLSTGTPERKAQILAKLAKDYGVEIDALYDLEDAEPANPELAQIQQRIGGIERLIAEKRQQAQTQLIQNAEAQVVAFAGEKDATGNPLRPHLEKVRVTMGRMIDEDATLTLEAAYDKAVQDDPKLRKAALAKQRAAPASKPGKSKRAKPAKELSLRDTILEAHRRDAERAGA